MFLCRSSEESVEMFVCFVDLLKRVLRCFCVWCRSSEESVEMFVCLCRSSEGVLSVCVFV